MEGPQRLDSALWADGPTATHGPAEIEKALPRRWRRAIDLTEDQGFKPRMVLPPNRISSSSLGCPYWVHLDHLAALVSLDGLYTRRDYS